MGIDFGSRFNPNGNTTTNNDTSSSSRPTAQVWLNIGYEITVDNGDGTTSDHFIQLPLGCPLDTQEPKVPNSRDPNSDYAQKIAAGNGLLEQLNAVAKDLAPGENIVLNGLSIQVHRAAGKQAPVAATEGSGNKFAADLKLSPVRE